MDAERETLDLYCLMENALGCDGVDEFLKCDENNSWSNHFGIGLWLRNNVLTKDNSIYLDFVSRGVVDKDEMSADLLEGFYWYLKTKDNKNNSI